MAVKWLLVWGDCSEEVAGLEGSQCTGHWFGRIAVQDIAGSGGIIEQEVVGSSGITVQEVGSLKEIAVQRSLVRGDHSAEVAGLEGSQCRDYWFGRIAVQRLLIWGDCSAEVAGSERCCSAEVTGLGDRSEEVAGSEGMQCRGC
ncbi:unnamed protein product [Natator depressus]